MSMDVTYNIQMDNEHSTVLQAICQVPMYGRWTRFTVTSYCVTNPYHGESVTALNFGIDNLATKDVRGSSFAACQDGKLKLRRENQRFEQQINIPRIFGSLLDHSDLTNGGVPAGRTVAAAVISTFESIVETCRQRIRTSFGRDVRELAYNQVETFYWKETTEALEQILGKIDWRLMLAKSGGCDEFFTAVEGGCKLNFPRFLAIADEPSTEIRTIKNALSNKFDRATIANIRATGLLHRVCGEKLGREFDETGGITVREQGYEFVIKPQEWVQCTDPNGKTAKLCIHTIGFQCNPIDEVIITYLHIRHMLPKYMAEAIAHGADRGFDKALAA